MANEIYTRLQLKYDTLVNWQAVKDTFVPLAGEICLAKIEVTDPANKLLQPVMAKVGDGTSTWGQLDWMSAKAADIYGWAKKATLDADDLPAIPVEKLPVDAIDTDLDTRYSITLDSDETNGDRIKIVTQLYSKGVASGDATTDYIDIVTPAELATALAAYYTKNDIDDMVAGKLHTQAEIETIAVNKVNALIEGAVADDTIEKIADLVTYIDKHADVVTQMNTDIKTANDNAASAVETANTTNTTANQALDKANEALNGATGAANSAAEAKASEDAAKGYAAEALASKNAAAGSADDAARDAGTATAKAGEAAQSAIDAGNAKAEALQAKADAVIAQGEAEKAQVAAEQAKADAEAAKSAANTSAQGAAESARFADEAKGAAEGFKGEAEAAKEAAVNAQTGAENAQEAAESARDAAVAAKEAAEASNTSATAIANEAKATAGEAKTAADAATEAVAGLHAIATSGSVYDVEEGSNVSTGTDAGVKYLVFNCGTASTVI